MSVLKKPSQKGLSSPDVDQNDTLTLTGIYLQL